MPVVKQERFMPYSAKTMYDLVNDIEAYPEFLTWCRKAIVHRREDNLIEATLALAKGPLHKSFTTRNYLQPNKMIEMRLIDGPFKHLDGFWRFSALDEHSSRVAFDLSFEFSAKPLALVAGPIFGQITQSLVDSFCKRAEAIYGKP